MGEQTNRQDISIESEANKLHCPLCNISIRDASVRLDASIEPDKLDITAKHFLIICNACKKIVCEKCGYESENKCKKCMLREGVVSSPKTFGDIMPLLL